MPRRIAAGLAVAALAVLAAPARAADPSIVIGSDGETAAAFSYADAIRERVFIPLPGIDQDLDGVADRTAIDIIRPQQSGPAMKVPAIVDPSPYYTTLGRGNESQKIADLDGDGLLDRWPLFYDNFFVPRGYAVILADMDGTGNSSGCPMHGGPGDVASMKAVIDWLNGRVPGIDKDGNPKVADWHSGKAAMIGKSYDGTLANGVAATGVDGLTTIVPISAIADWYDYSRMGGIRFNNNYPGNSLAAAVTNSDRLNLCAPTRTAMNNADGDETGDINDFWAARAYSPSVDKVKAAVFASHGFQDDNVRINHLAKWWSGLAANHVPRKLWLTRTGHVDPFEYRRAAWVDELHRWFDHWLYGIDNGIMDEPRVDIESAKDTWTQYADWPVPGSTPTDVYLRGTSETTAGVLGATSGGSTDSVAWTDAPGQSETTMLNTPEGSQVNRRVFLSPVLTHELHLSGTPSIDIQASLDKPQTNLGALLVDYGAGTQVTRTGDGVSNTNPIVRTCWGESSASDSACYIEVTKPTLAVTQWRVSKGILDSSNRDSLLTPTLAEVGTKYRLQWPTLPAEHVFAAGHRIGVVLVGNYTQYTSIAATTGAKITLDTRLSKVSLPIVGGYDAAVAAGALAPDTTAPDLHGIPADITTTSPGPNGVAVAYTAPTATDDEDPSPDVACVPASGSVFAVGTTTVTCTATDASGNTATATFSVKVTWADSDQGTVGGTVPGTLSLALGAPASFGAFTPGVARDYTASMTANVISTAGEAALTVADPSPVATGHLVNGTYSLASALQARASSAAGVGSAFAPIGGSAAPTLLLGYAGPVSNDAVTIGFTQRIAATDPLRTGTYSKTLTFTLSTTTP